MTSEGTSMPRSALIAASVVAAIAGVVGATVAVSAPSARTTATCTSSPAITPGATSDSFRVTCSVPKQPTATVTVTQTVTATASPTSTPTLPPTSTVTATPTTSVPTTTAPTTSSPTTPTGGFPNANTTGPRVATSPGSGNVCGTVSGRLVTGDLVLGCDSTVTDSRIMGRVVSNGYRLTGSYLEIGPDSCPTSGAPFQLIRDVFTLDHSHLHNAPGQDPIALVPGTSSLTDSLVDKPCFYAGDHLDGAQVYAPGSKVVATLDHNTIDVRPANSSDKGNAAIFLADNPGRGTTITMTNNLLAGGNYTLSAYDATGGSGVVYDARDNTFVKGSYVYGPCASNSAAYDGTSGLRFTGNRYDDGSPLSSC